MQNGKLSRIFLPVKMFDHFFAMGCIRDYFIHQKSVLQSIIETGELLNNRFFFVSSDGLNLRKWYKNRLFDDGV